MADDGGNAVPGLIQPGNIDLYNRPKIPNPQGGISTVYSTSFGDDKGREILVPRAADGTILSEKEAEQRYYRTGKHLGIFDSPEHATAYAEKLHNEYAAGKYDRKTMADQNNPWAVVSEAPAPKSSPQPAPSSGIAPKTAQTPQNPWQVVSETPVQPTATISAVHEPQTFIGKFGRWAENVANDIRYGTDETGIGTVLKKMGAHGVYNGNSEAVGDFMASLPLGLLKVGKGTAEVSPQIMGGPKGQTWQGLKDIASGGLQAVTMPAAFVAPEESPLSKEGLLSDAASQAQRATDAAVTGASKAARATTRAAKAVTAPFRESAAQPELQAGLRKVAGAVTREAEVAAPKTPSIYKTVEEAAGNIYAKAKSQYAELDKATNGRVQRFADRLENIREQLNSLTGTEEDVDKEAKLLKAQKETEDAMQDAFKDARAQGVDPKLVDQASANFKQSQALYDLDTAIQRSTSGKPLGVGRTKGLPETVDPKKLAPRITALWKSGRLQQAVGDENTADLMDYVGNAAKQQKAAIRNKMILKIAGIASGAGGLTHKLLSDQ
ncbi:MAG: hypothetical protein ABSE40_11950 [Candidatus Sulfotelmatobacter sp.]|jgi:hypothetical protein